MHGKQTPPKFGSSSAEKPNETCTSSVEAADRVRGSLSTEDGEREQDRINLNNYAYITKLLEEEDDDDITKHPLICVLLPDNLET